MNSVPSPRPATPTIQSRDELDAVVENIVQLQLDRAEIERSQDQEIADIRQKYRAPLAEIERYLTLETSWVENWARLNPGAFAGRQSLALTHAVIGFRISPHRVDRASRKWTWTDIARKLGEFSWGRRYLRQPALEVNKEALLADRAEFAPAELKQAGLKIVQEERFYEEYATPTEAKQLKGWSRAKKLKLIQTQNPDGRNLFKCRASTLSAPFPRVNLNAASNSRWVR